MGRLSPETREGLGALTIVVGGGAAVCIGLSYAPLWIAMTVIGIGCAIGMLGIFLPILEYLFERGWLPWPRRPDADDRDEPPADPLMGNSRAGYLPRLEGFATGIGYTVTYDAPPPGRVGDCNPHTSRIVIAPDRPANAQVWTLLHELGHALSIEYAEEYGEAVAEVIAEAAAARVCAAIGLDTSGRSLAYIASWGGDSAMLRQHAAKIGEVTQRLARACGLVPRQRTVSPAAPQG